MKMSIFDVRPLLAWFHANKRPFPWRNNPSPYAVLVSEVMLQQTQATRVLQYFSLWMDRFPTFADLAKASENVVLKSWEGLGYYSRARALHACAKVICGQYFGNLPRGKDELLKLPGIGPYTAGAILSFAFKQKAEAIDANVRRVFFRLIADVFNKDLTGIVEAMLPSQEPHIVMEAFIELGALVCTKRPKCEQCPCRDFCYAYNTNRIDEVTVCKKNERIPLWRDVGLFLTDDSVLLKNPPLKGLMRGLYEFPYLEGSQKRRSGEAFLEELFPQTGGSLKVERLLDIVCHSFTKYSVVLHPIVIRSTCRFSLLENTTWACFSHIRDYTFSSGHKRVLNALLCSP
jgi:A/G-specific adenine glycosylase